MKADLQKFEEKLTELKQNESIKKAKEVFAKAKDDVFRQNAAIVSDVKGKADAVRQVVGTVAGKVGDTISTVSRPIKDLGEKIKPYVPDVMESKVVKRVSKSAAEAEEKLLENTNVYQYGGFKSKELRERSRLRAVGGAEGKEKNSSTSSGPTEVNPNAGDSMVVHEESKWASKWNNFVDNNRVLQRIFGVKQAYEESNNLFVYFTREISNSISDRLASVFAETETARAMREIQLRDPSFSLEKFMKFATEQIAPEILDALLAADLPTLRVLSSEAMYNMLKVNFEAQLKQPGYRMEGKVLDMRHLELDGQAP